MCNEINLEELEALANAAGGVKWIACGPSYGEAKPAFLDEVNVDDDEYPKAVCQYPAGCRSDVSDKMAYIAEANPATLLSLLDRLKSAEAERDALAAKLAELEWISIADAMPNTQQRVDIAYIDENGKPQTTMGWYCRARTLESANFAGDVDDEYDEETYTYYLKEQWVDESQEAEYHYSITGVTHWKPRAKHPDSKH